MKAGGRLAADSHPQAELRQIAVWRRMSPAQKLEMVGELRQTVLDLARAGIRQRYPGAGERECFLRLMLLTLGSKLACAAYPEAAHLPDRTP
ncbi:MAG TPA: hypothetical protein VIE13_01570 [Terriglobales bacterium]|jgi:hypothetical protein